MSWTFSIKSTKILSECRWLDRLILAAMDSKPPAIYIYASIFLIAVDNKPFQERLSITVVLVSKLRHNTYQSLIKYPQVIKRINFLLHIYFLYEILDFSVLSLAKALLYFPVNLSGFVLNLAF
jgi:hypothetical protein